MRPVNAAKNSRVANYSRDGAMRSDNGGGGDPNYWPNSMGGPGPEPSAAVPGIEVIGKAMKQARDYDQDDFAQTGVLYSRVMSDQDRANLVGNIVSHLGGAQKRIQLRQTALFYKADSDYGTRVAEGLGLDVKEVEELAAMSQEERAAATS